MESRSRRAGRESANRVQVAPWARLRAQRERTSTLGSFAISRASASTGK